MVESGVKRRVKMWIQTFDQMIGKYGLQGTADYLVKKTSGRLQTFGLTKDVQKILASKPVIVICNHPHDIETFALAATLPRRNDVFLVASKNLQAIGVNLARHIIPVYTQRQERGKGKHYKFSVKIGRHFNFGRKVSDTEAHQFNINSISQAAQKINRGGLVAIFPEGPRGKEGRWLDGVGYLLLQLIATKKVYVVTVYVQGTADRDIFRLVPGLGRFFPEIQVFYSQPRLVKDIVGTTKTLGLNNKDQYKQTAKRLVHQEEQKYKEWVGGLK